MGTRYIHLIRHGQYQMHKDHIKRGHLTSLGQFQARCVFKRLKDHDVSKIISSTMVRAEETAHEINKRFNFKYKVQKSTLLREGIPSFTEKLIKQTGIKKSKIKNDKARMNQAFKKYFIPFKSKGERHDVLVCHGNVIRYLVSKAIKVDELKWLNLDIIQCSLTTISIREDGRMLLVCYGEVGHIPVHKRTFL